MIRAPIQASPSNPAARLGKLFSLRHDPRRHVTVLEPDGVARVLTAATKGYPDHELAVRVLFYTGMREGERRVRSVLDALV